MTWGERISTLIAWLLVGALVFALSALWPRSEAYSHRSEAMEERVRLLEATIAEERESCRVDHELAERAGRAWEALERNWRLEP